MLDIFDGLQTIEFGLAQGVEFKNLNALVIQDKTVCAPELLGYSIPKQTNIIEGFPNPTSGTTKTITELESEFTTTLAIYTTKQNLFMMESKNKSTPQLKTTPIYGKNVEAELSALNTKLTTLARQINTARAKEHSTNTQLGVTQTRYWNTFKNNANKYYSSTLGGAITDATLDAKEESSGLFATTNKMHFYIWFVFAILLLWYLLRVVYKSATSIYDPDTLTVFNWQNLIIFVCCIWTISVVWKWRPPWMRAEWYTIPAWLR